MIAASIVLAAIFAALGFLVYYGERKFGAQEQRLKDARETLDDAQKVKPIVADPSYDDKLRDKYGVK